MKKLAVVFLLIITMLFGSACQNENNSFVDYSVDMRPRLISVNNNKTTSEIVNLVSPAIVGVLAKIGTAESVGSGVCIASDGYIITNQHVVENANKITVYFANKDYSGASLIWSDKALDLAVLKSETSLPYLEMAQLISVMPGDDVVAIGTPLSLQFKHSSTKGIVSALDRTLEVNDGSYLQNLIQHDASLNPGNSGGPLINGLGKVIGINTLKAVDAEGIGFAIPIDVCVPLVDQLSRKAKIETPYLGIFGFDATIASFYGQTANEKGVFVLNVEKNSPAATAGLKVDDVITGMNGEIINSMLDLRINLYKYDIGSSVILNVKRENSTIELTLVLVKR